MAYELNIQPRGEYLHAIVSGDNTRDNVARYLHELRRECISRNCARLLIEERLAGARLPLVDVFQVVVEESERAAGLFQAIAYVDVNAGGDLMKFAESLAVERGIPVRLFATVAEAERWLTRASR